jgi:hypothetical protein
MRKFIQWLLLGILSVGIERALAVTSNLGAQRSARPTVTENAAKPANARPTQGANSGAQYDPIARRNVFGLKEPVEAPSTNTPPLADPAIPKLTLTGITTILGNKLALFKVQFPGEGGKPGKEDSLMLAEGQRDSGIEVLQIDEKAKRVRVNNSGRMMPVEFDKDSLKSTGGTNAAALAGSTPGQTPPTPGFHIPRLPSRSLQAPAGNGTTPTAAPPPPPNPFSRAPAASYEQTNNAATTTATANTAYPTNSTGAYNNNAATVEQRSSTLTPTGLTPEQIAVLQAAAAAADGSTQAVRQVPAPMSRPPTMPLVPQ